MKILAIILSMFLFGCGSDEPVCICADRADCLNPDPDNCYWGHGNEICCENTKSSD